jgi:hypothetical protein
MKAALRNGFVLSVVGALLVGGAIAFLLAGGGSSGSKSNAKVLQISLRRGIYPSLGLGLEQPTSWLTATPAGVLTLSSPDAGQTTMSISVLGPASQEAKLRPALNSQLVKTFQPAKVIGRSNQPIGKTPAISTAILGTSGGKRKILIISTAISSAYRTYGIQVFFKSLRPSRQSELEVHNVLTSIRFFAPTGG